jgi:hypothetical protein
MSALPCLPLATVPVKKYRYKQKKVVGKGPEEIDVIFIMTLPWMERDLRSKDFISALQCTSGI